MQLRNKKNGFSFVELVVVIAILAVLLAVLSPMLISSVEHSRMQRDDSAMDEVVNAVHLAITDDKVFDEAYGYCISNNYMTYTDSSGVYGNRTMDEEFWAPDGSGPAVTITFNPDENGNYDIGKGIVNDMTYGNGSVAEKRTADEDLKQCYFEEMGNQLLYSAVKQSIGNTISEKSATYKNSSYTVFIRYYLADGTRKADVYGAFNGTNLSEECPAAIGSNTSSYDEEDKPISTTPTGGRQESNYTNSDLSGGGNLPSYKNPSSEDDENSLDDGYNHNAAELHPNGVIPEGATYTQNGVRYTAGQPFPSTVEDGDTYIYGDYMYIYNYHHKDYAWTWETHQSQNGWGVGTANSKINTAYGPILESINNKPITNIDHLFNKCEKFTDAPAIPIGVTSMEYAFKDCSITAPPNIPKNMTNMKGAFMFCSSITTAPIIPNGVTDLSYAFAGCGRLITAPTIPSSTKEINNIFNGCGSIITYIGSKDINGDFSNYKIPMGVTNLTCSFSGCSAITTAPTIPSSVTNMGYAFYGCSSLITAPLIPEGVTSLYRTFTDCSSLSTASAIPNSVTDMSCAFYGCTSLTTAPDMSQANNVTTMSNTFYNCTSLTTAPVIPSSVTNMYYTFYECTSLTGTIEINANPTNYTACFWHMRKPITLTGLSTILNSIKGSSSTNNIKVG